MTLSEEARDRLADVVARQPTKNGELQELWGLESGSEVHQYLENELKEYYYRNENSLICATPEAAELVGGEGGQMTVSPLQGTIVEVLAGPEAEPQSVVATLHAVREAGRDPDVDAVRSALRGLVDMGIAETVQKTVPTFRLTVERDELDVEVRED